ncbi:YkoP family protein [Cohnella boryungensis]|uniref:Polysaccharide deacetylase n=1 Tax=Cohnella boryungensis TaxID=768479 RepID=A0ABV8S937_9BACL
MENQVKWSTDRATLARGIALVKRSGCTARQRIWMAWEKVMLWIMGLNSEGKIDAGMCKVIVKKYKGPSFDCEDGTRIEQGDLVGELHLNNQMILGLTREAGAGRAALQTARLARTSLKEISAALDKRPELTRVKALLGVTLLHRGLTHGLGFEQRRLPSKRFERITAVYLKLLLFFLHPDGLERSDRCKEKLTPIMLVCTRSNLLRRFSPDNK